MPPVFGPFQGDTAMPMPAADFDAFLARVHRFTRDQLMPAEDEVEAADAVPERIVARNNFV